MIKQHITDFFSTGHQRSILAKKNIAVSFAIKGATILMSLITIPLTINYVGAERNGIWLTLYSMVLWLGLFDIGLGNGLKNKLAEAKAKGETELAKKYVSSTYATVSLIFVGTFGVFCLINPHLNWLEILKTVPAEYSQEVSGLIWIMMASFCLTFILNLLKAVVTADQRPAIGSFLDMLGQLVTLIGIVILSQTVPPSLISLGLVTGFAPVIVLLIAGFVLFNRHYKAWTPSLKLVDFKLAGSLLNLGVQFFIATCASFVVTQALPFLIQRMTNPTEVTNYNTALRLFSLAFNVMGIIIMPYWSSFTDAYVQKDFSWMQNSITRLRQFFVVLLIVQLVLLVGSPLIYYLWVNYWVNTPLDISFLLSAAVCLNACVLCWVTLHIYPLNGIGKVRLQVYSSIVEMVLLIPVALWMGHRWGVVGIVLAPVIIYIPRMIWSPIQINKLTTQKAKGIWNK
ncbi:O-antigen export protein [Bacteroidia bacterium]|nr:O-antigen export protein [Bacteroidia bacterium]